MGGFGSGHYRMYKQETIEEQLCINIDPITKRGLLENGVTGTLRWSRRGEPCGAVSVTGGIKLLTFRYTYSSHGIESESIEQRIDIERTPCYFGGSRPWFTCPRCSSRAGVLILAGKRFACRKCCRIPYACQIESKLDQASRRIRKIQKRLGNPEWENVLDYWFPKPKGMHWQTYNRIVAQAGKPLRAIEAEMATLKYS